MFMQQVHFTHKLHDYFTFSGIIMQLHDNTKINRLEAI